MRPAMDLAGVAYPTSYMPPTTHYVDPLDASAYMANIKSDIHYQHSYHHRQPAACLKEAYSM